MKKKATFKLIFDRKKRVSSTKAGPIELRITYNRVQKFLTTGVRVLPSQWDGGRVVNRPDADKIQLALDDLMDNAARIVNEYIMAGYRDLDTIMEHIRPRPKNRIYDTGIEMYDSCVSVTGGYHVIYNIK
jgi:hypothetical protein